MGENPLSEMSSSTTDKKLPVRVLTSAKLDFSDSTVLTGRFRHHTTLTAVNFGLLSSASMITRPLRYVVALRMQI